MLLYHLKKSLAYVFGGVGIGCPDCEVKGGSDCSVCVVRVEVVVLLVK